MLTERPKCSLRDRLASSDQPCLILDGGMGTALNGLGLNEQQAWEAPFLLHDPIIRQSVRSAHRSFLAQNVDILMTNTYLLGDRNVVVGDTNMHVDFNVDQVALDNITLAKEAIDDFMVDKGDMTRPLLALSVSSFSTAIVGRAETANREHAEGTDYIREEGYGVDRNLITSYFHSRLSDKILQHAEICGVSVVAIETVGDGTEVEVICDVLREKAAVLQDAGISTWVTLTCADTEKVDTGATVAGCLEMLAKCQPLSGVGINCTEPHLVLPLLKKIKTVLQREAEDKLIVVYPNSGETYLNRPLEEGESENWTWRESGMGAEWNFAQEAVKWVEEGANIVGGCCRITAGEIGEFSRLVKRRML